jgi:hypothetical protein
MNRKIQNRLHEEILAAFRFFADSKYTGFSPVRPVSMIVFGAEGPIVDPPSFEFYGFGTGPEGEAFSQTGSLDLSEIFGNEWKDETAMKKKFSKACGLVTEVLGKVAKTPEYLSFPKKNYVVFTLSISDQFQQVLCRISADGKIELPPAKK